MGQIDLGLYGLQRRRLLPAAQEKLLACAKKLDKIGLYPIPASMLFITRRVVSITEVCVTRYLVFFVFLLCGCQVSQTVSPQVVIYTYHSDPPFFLPDQPTDLSRAWVDRFNQWQSKIQLRVEHIERGVLNQRIEEGNPYLILWANPLFFISWDPMLLSSDTIFWDADILVSRKQQPIDYHRPPDLIGYRLGGRRGFYYKGLNELSDEGKLTRIDADNDNQNYERLLRQEVDLFIMQRSAWYYWRSNGLDETLLYVASEPHDGYSRHVLASAEYAELLRLINEFIAVSRQDAMWRAQLMKWGVEGLMNPFELELEELLDADVDKQR